MTPKPKPPKPVKARKVWAVIDPDYPYINLGELYENEELAKSAGWPTDIVMPVLITPAPARAKAKKVKP